MSAQALREELERPPKWMYEWDLGELGSPPLLGPSLPQIHRRRAQLIEHRVRGALEVAGGLATAIDLGCSEGWFCHRLLEWGAQRVVGVDARAQNIERARLIRDHLGMPADRLELIHSDVFDLDVGALGHFDVVLALGLIYHVEDPVGALRRAHRLTRRLCVVESQLSCQVEPIVYGLGSPGDFDSSAASFAAVLEPDAGENPIAAVEGTLAMVPNAAAAELSLRTAGFERVEWIDRNERGMLAAFHSPPPGQRASWLDFYAVTGRVHPNDDILFPPDVRGEHYARSGQSAVDCIEAALELAGRSLDDVESCLDMACGYGRVLRLLRERIDPRRITACDVEPEAVAYCAYEFGATPLLSDPEFEGVPFQTYDLIWVGSLITHLDARLFDKFTALLPRLLSPGGVLLLTTLGDFGIGDVSVYEPRLAVLQEELEATYRRDGFAFVPYQGLTEGLGYTWHSPEYLRRAVESASDGAIEQLASWPRGWDAHQDVSVFRHGAP